MPIDPKTKRWFPSVCKKQAELLADKHMFVDVEGPRLSAKSIGCLHKIVAHAWETPHARVGMVGRALTDNYDGGAWQDLVEIVIPQWIEGNFGMKWVTEPKSDGLTHKMYCEITNKFGGISRFSLESVKEETTAKLERVFKNRRFSCIYFTEASNFKRQKTFTTAQECLRHSPIATPEEVAQTRFLFLIDTNPAEEGESHWIYQLFHVFRQMSKDELVKAFGSDPKILQANLEYQQSLSVQRFTLEDNIWMTPAQRARQHAKYAHDPDEYDRHVLGLWKKLTKGTVFCKVFKPDRHVVGDNRNAYVAKPQIMVPEPGCFELGVGWDIGGINLAVAFVEKLWVKTKEGHVVPAFKAIDEIVILDTPTKVQDFVEEVLERMAFWENLVGRKIVWKHWSDRSAFDKYENVSDTYEAKEVFRASDGEIELVAAAFESGGRPAVQQRITMLQKLFHQNRLYISAQCEGIIESISMLKFNARGKLATGDRNKHAFDALSYYICMENYAEMEEALLNQVSPPSVAGVFSTKI